MYSMDIFAEFDESFHEMIPPRWVSEKIISIGVERKKCDA